MTSPTHADPRYAQYTRLVSEWYAGNSAILMREFPPERNKKMIADFVALIDSLNPVPPKTLEFALAIARHESKFFPVAFHSQTPNRPQVPDIVTNSATGYTACGLGQIMAVTWHAVANGPYGYPTGLAALLHHAMQVWPPHGALSLAAAAAHFLWRFGDKVPTPQGWDEEDWSVALAAHRYAGTHVTNDPMVAANAQGSIYRFYIEDKLAAMQPAQAQR